MADDTNTTLFLGQAESQLLLALIFCFGLTAIGFKDRRFLLLAGPVWMFCGAAIFISYGVVFMLMSVAIGLVVMIDGALSIR